MASLNQAIDLDAKRLEAVKYRIPGEVWLMLVAVSLLASLTVGYCMPRRFLLTVVVTPLMIVIVFTLIADLDTPVKGLIRIPDESMIRLQHSLQEMR
jgi:hypothetical protein